MIVGGYSLHLYCDNNKGHRLNDSSSKAEYDDIKESFCFAKAKSDGWKIDRKNGTAICPTCRKKK